MVLVDAGRPQPGHCPPPPALLKGARHIPQMRCRRARVTPHWERIVVFTASGLISAGVFVGLWALVATFR